MLNSITALVADDDPLIIEIVSSQLEICGAEVVYTADSGRAALEAMSAHPTINLVVCDLRMPDMDGIELLRSLEAGQRQFSLILISSLGDKILRAAEQLASVRGFHLLGALTKPVTLQALRRVLAGEGVSGESLDGYAVAGPDAERIRDAVNRRNFEIFVQPQIDLQSGAVETVEVLTRWLDADLASFDPGVIIRRCEDLGLIDELTDTLLAQVGEAWQEWQKAGLGPRLAINVSARSLEHVGFPERFQRGLARYGIAPERVVIEITESAVTESLTISLDVVTRLRVMGFDLSIDDFGTGYSNLEKLRNLPFEELKIDLSFVSGLPQDRDARTIVESSIQLAHSLSLRAVAEGVETQGQLDCLRDMGCDLAQGFLIARPMPANAFPQWLDGQGGG